MRKKVWYLVISMILVIMLSVFGCSSSGGGGEEGAEEIIEDTGPSPEDIAAAAQAVDNGIAAMKDQDWDLALDFFIQAINLDPNNNDAKFGYSLLNLLSIFVDPTIVALARTNLGITSYPSKINTLIEPDAWMNDRPWDWSGTPPDIAVNDWILFPDVKNVKDFNDDGVIDFYDYMLGVVQNFALNNTGFNEIFDTVADVLGARLDYATSAVDQIDDEWAFSITWEMVYDVEPYPQWNDYEGQYEDNGWPYRYNADHTTVYGPVKFVIGKAELYALAAELKQIRMFTYLAKVLDMTLPLENYWNAINWETEEIDYSSLEPPFKNFLKPRDGDGEPYLGEAKKSFLNSLFYVDKAIEDVLSRRSDESFTVSKYSDWSEISDYWESSAVPAMNFASLTISKARDSVNKKTVMIFPTDFSDHGEGPEGFWNHYTENDGYYWPETIIPATGDNPPVSVGVNLGAFFSSPVGAISSILELDADGEPAFYVYNDNGIEKVLTIPDPSGEYNPPYFVKVKDITLGGVIPVKNIPVDNPSTIFYNFNMSWTDNGNTVGLDPADTISYAEFYKKIEGLVDSSNPAYGGDPIGYYYNASKLDELTFSNYYTLVSGDFSQFLSNLTGVTDLRFYNGDTLLILDGTSLYVGEGLITPEMVWNSMTAPGTIDGDYTSSGSFWWALIESMSSEDEK